MYRLRDMEYLTDTAQRPRYFGLLTNDIAHDHLAPDVLKNCGTLIRGGNADAVSTNIFSLLTMSQIPARVRDDEAAN
jgi:hypothetical protein